MTSAIQVAPTCLRVVGDSCPPEAGLRPASSQPARRVLMICQAFPPTGGPGVQRSAKFAKYLPELGWTPVIWSGDGLDQLPHDSTLADDLPGELIRCGRRAGSHAAACRNATDALRALGVKRLLGRTRWAGLRWRLDRAIRWCSAHMVPDDQVGWMLRSAGPLLGLARRAKVDVVYSTYSPISSHLLGRWVKRNTGLPWVADFRDLWTDDYGYGRPNRLRRGLDHRIQSAILRNADGVIGVTPSQVRILKRHVPDQAEKFVCIPNGFDRDDFPAVDPRREDLTGRVAGRFVLTFAGWFLSDRADDGLIDGVGRFARWAGAREGSFEFRIVGTVSGTMVRRFAAAGATVRAVGYLPHRAAIRCAVGSDVLLLPVPRGPNAGALIPGKLFEYLASGRPILLVGPADGEAQRLVREHAAGVCVESVAELVFRALVRFWHAWRADRAPPGCAPDRLEPFSRRCLTARLASVLREVTCPERRRRMPATGARCPRPGGEAGSRDHALPFGDGFLTHRRSVGSGRDDQKT